MVTRNVASRPPGGREGAARPDNRAVGVLSVRLGNKRFLEFYVSLNLPHRNLHQISVYTRILSFQTRLYPL